MAYKWKVLLCALPALTLVLVDLTIVNVALAKLSAVFGVDLSTVGWTITAFALAMGVATPLVSFIEMRFTTKRVWIAALMLFTGGSVLSGLAPAFWVLVLGRLLQGTAAGMMLPLLLGVFFRVFAPSERGSAMGLLAIPIVAGPALGPTIGGYIVTYMDWRLVFFINLPVGVIAMAMAFRMLRPSHPRPEAHFDAIGAVLSSVGFGSVLYGLSSVSKEGWDSLAVRGFIGIGVLSLVALYAYELTQEEPLLDVRLFRQPQFLIGNVVNWVGAIALLGAEFMVPLYLQNLRGLTALDAGLLLLPQGFAAALAGPMAGRLVDRFGARYVTTFGALLLALNTWDLSQLTLETPLGTLRWLLVLRGLALGFVMTGPRLTAIAAAPDHLRTNASSLTTAMQSVSQSLGVAWLATMVQTQSVVHEAVLSWDVRPDTLAGETVRQVSAALQAMGGWSPETADTGAITFMLGQVASHAATLAFGDAYRVTFIMAVAAALLALLLPGRMAAQADQTVAIG